MTDVGRQVKRELSISCRAASGAVCVPDRYPGTGAPTDRTAPTTTHLVLAPMRKTEQSG